MSKHTARAQQKLEDYVENLIKKYEVPAKIAACLTSLRVVMACKADYDKLWADIEVPTASRTVHVSVSRREWTQHGVLYRGLLLMVYDACKEGNPPAAKPAVEGASEEEGPDEDDDWDPEAEYRRSLKSKFLLQRISSYCDQEELDFDMYEGRSDDNFLPSLLAAGAGLADADSLAALDEQDPDALVDLFLAAMYSAVDDHDVMEWLSERQEEMDIKLRKAA
ncbi:hypothetical protein WJX72_004321 [[Myrmecia] bisecta]|uniref:Uncharacterized protein n=1 Tax=[Myrmecia] bisecta TaxID=41462 RepID=A0AAW1PY86_9CHLO